MQTKGLQILSLIIIIPAIIITGLKPALINIGNRDLWKITIASQTDSINSSDTNENRAIISSLSQSALKYLGYADKLGSSYETRWAVIRTALASNQPQIALDILRNADLNSSNPLLCQDILLAYSEAGDWSNAIAFYTKNTSLPQTQKVRDIVALAYLQEARTFIEAGNLKDAKPLLMKVLGLRESDLYANWYLWKWSREEKDQKAEAVYRDGLETFQVSAIIPSETRLLNFIVSVIPDINETGLWSHDEVERVVALLVLRYSKNSEISQLLKQLSKLEPHVPAWLFYEGELNERNGDFQAAWDGYQGVIKIDPPYPGIYLRLDTLCQQNSGLCNPDIEFALLSKHYQSNPDDILGLRRLVTVAQQLSDPRAADWETQLAERSDPKYLISKLVNMSMDSFDLGPELLTNGGFENSSSVSFDWLPHIDTAGDQWFNSGAFDLSLDRINVYDGQSSGVVSGFWSTIDVSRSPAGAGWQYRIGNQSNPTTVDLLPGKAYELGVAYRTSPSETPVTWAGTLQPALTPPLNQEFSHIEPTNGAWVYYIKIVCNTTKTVLKASPIVRSFYLGQTWIDGMSLKEIQVKNINIGLCSN